MNGGLFFKRNEVSFNSVATDDVNTIKGMPSGSYGYGRLITITTGELYQEYSCVQIYMPHVGNNVFIRVMATNKWTEIGASSIKEAIK